MEKQNFPASANPEPSVGDVGNDLVGLIYDTAIDAELWPLLFERLLQHPAISSSDEDIRFESEAGTLLLPHFERALKLSGEFYQLRSERNVLTDMINRFPVGIVIVQANANIVVCNRRADDIIARSKALAIEENELHVHRDSARTIELRRLIRQVAHGEAPSSTQPSAFVIAGEGGSHPLSMWVTPVGDILSESSGDFAAIMITSADSLNRINADAVTASYGLTPAEGRLVKTLLNGCHSLPEAAEKLQITSNTARSQLKSVFGKMNVSSQNELLKRIFTSPSLFVDVDRIGKRQPALTTEISADDPFHLIRLYDGRNLEYREYGDPEGVPLIFLHSMVHSRKVFNPFSDCIERLGVRVISPERPGYGRSEMQLKRSIGEFAKDVAQLADHLGIERFYMAGEMDGSSYVLACAHHLPERVIAASVISCLPKPEEDEIEKLISFERTIMMLMKKTPIFINHLGKILIRGMQKNPDKYFERFGKELCEPDRNIFMTPEHRAVFRESLENITAENIDGFIDNYFSRLFPWDFDPSKIKVPVQLWHGEQDQRSPIRFARKLASDIPDCTAQFIEDGGHCIFYSHWQQALTALISRE